MDREIIVFQLWVRAIWTKKSPLILFIRGPFFYKNKQTPFIYIVYNYHKHV